MDNRSDLPMERPGMGPQVLDVLDSASLNPGKNFLKQPMHLLSSRVNLVPRSSATTSCSKKPRCHKVNSVNLTLASCRQWKKTHFYSSSPQGLGKVITHTIKHKEEVQEITIIILSSIICRVTHSEKKG